jgi:hypothetical protein
MGTGVGTGPAGVGTSTMWMSTPSTGSKKELCSMALQAS